MTMLGIPMPAKPPPKATSKKGGKSSAAASDKSGSQNLAWIWALCPLHWDDNTKRLLTLVAGLAWLGGVIVGWSLHRVQEEGTSFLSWSRRRLV
mmetsp:Transcript_37932/g.107261  ORF Transcript_37932/g.107261 Transcript_37932/m.107261 type:complete len:94 (+) Transcript_37932:119-400(+)